MTSLYKKSCIKEKTQIKQAIKNKAPPSFWTSIPKGVNKWKNTAPLMMHSAISEPISVKTGFLKIPPIKSMIEAINSAEPIT